MDFAGQLQLRLRPRWSESQSSSSRQRLAAFRRDPRDPRDGDRGIWGHEQRSETTGHLGSWVNTTRPTKKKKITSNSDTQFLKKHHPQPVPLVFFLGYIIVSIVLGVIFPTYGDDDHSLFGNRKCTNSQQWWALKKMRFNMVSGFRHFFHFIWDVIPPIDFHFFKMVRTTDQNSGNRR